MLPDVSCSGIVSQSGQIAAAAGELANDGTIKILAYNGEREGEFLNGDIPVSRGRMTRISLNPPADMVGKDLPGIAYRGAFRFKKDGDLVYTYSRNSGHLGNLDAPEAIHKLKGHNVFSQGATDVRLC